MGAADEFLGEPIFAKKKDAAPDADEDDGYILSFLNNWKAGLSEFVVFDAKDISKGDNNDYVMMMIKMMMMMMMIKVIMIMIMMMMIMIMMIMMMVMIMMMLIKVIMMIMMMIMMMMIKVIMMMMMMMMTSILIDYDNKNLQTILHTDKSKNRINICNKK
jgi:hypothetical protein